MITNYFDHIEHYQASGPQKTAVTLVVHGLNLRPKAMLFLVNWLNERGSEVYLVKLSGHHTKGIPINNVNATVWQQEMLEGYNIAKEASLQASVPLYFLGYSLGALLGQSMIGLSIDNKAFEKQILIAPAFAIRQRAYLLRLLFFLRRQMNLPSYTPKGYRVNKSMPLNIYQVLFTEEKKVLQSGPGKINTPTLIIIDPSDELVSYKRLVKLLNRKVLTDHRVVVLDQNLSERNTIYHHLVICEQTMGRRNWALVEKEFESFLFT